MSKKRHPNSVIKPVGMDKDFVLVSREFAQDHSISHFTRSVILDVSSRSEDYETNVATIMANFKVGRDKAESALREGVAAGYIHVRRETDARGRFCGTTYHISNSKAHLRIFVENQGWDHALKNQGLDSQGLDDQSVDSSHNYRKEETKEEKNQTFRASADAQAASGGEKAEGFSPQGASPSEPKARKKTCGSAGFDQFWVAYPNKKGKFRASQLWGKMNHDDRAAALAAIPAYMASDTVKRGFIQQGDVFLSKRTWMDYVVEPERQAEAEEETIVKALALDIRANKPEPHFAAHRWPTWASVPLEWMEKAKSWLTATYGPEGAYA